MHQVSKHTTSTRTYIYSELVEQMKIKGVSKQVTGNVLNNQAETFETVSVKFSLANLNRKINLCFHIQQIWSQEI